MSLQEELAKYKEKDNQPVEIYYDLCNAYAQAYMRTSKTEIESYKITKRDFLTNVITDRLFDYSRYNFDDWNKMSD